MHQSALLCINCTCRFTQKGTFFLDEMTLLLQFPNVTLASCLIHCEDQHQSLYAVVAL